MYTPAHFRSEDRRVARSVIAENPFATVVSVREGAPMLTHLPLLADQDLSYLTGHLARANQHSKLLVSEAKCTAAFLGPNCYITPSWYTECDVPTWNYAAVHITGRIEVITDYEETLGVLKEISSHFERSSREPWDFILPDDLADERVLMRSILAFRIRVETIETKIKMNQNRSQADMEGVVAGLRERSDEQSRLVREMMLDLLEKGIPTSK